ncbi:MAG: topoisomerase DNA-binding C4 zinc finger domain-containing protein [Candidatus Lokiarchaeota archaeon]|nr:topoisomerase DNA-binding C4 zinc finger domain-containing protein [Candidatus Lokiarchaeota archaeon]
MKDLSEEEEQWLEVFAKYNPFFEDLFSFFSKNNFLTEKQYEQLEEEIGRFEEDGNYILDKADFRFLKEHAEENEDLREILDIYEEDGFLDDSDYNALIYIKLELNPDFAKREIVASRSDNALQRNLKLNEIKEEITKEEQNQKLTYPKVCPNCSKKLAIYFGKNGPFFGCNGYPHCKYSFNIENTWNILCPDCGSLMHERTGSRGIFLGCGGYPDCKFTYPIRISKNVKSTLTPVKDQIKKKALDQQETATKITPDNILKIKPHEKGASRKRNPIFVLELENNKWWIGSSKNPSTTIATHREGKGNVWTRENKVIKVEEIIEDGDLTEVMIRYITKYGWKCVRGTNFNDSYNTYIPKKIQMHIKSQDGGLEYLNENEDRTRSKAVFILRLEHGKWYVGKSSNVNIRVSNLKKKGNYWIQMNKLIALEEVRENADLKEVTLEYMREYGWENVRGYAWSQWNMKNPPKELR